MKRLEIKFTPETEEQMEKRRYRRNVHRLLIIFVAVHFLFLLFLVLRHYEWLPEFDRKKKGVATAVSDPTEKTSKKVNPVASGSKILKDKNQAYHTGHSIVPENVSHTPFTSDSYKSSVSSLYDNVNTGLYGVDVSHWQGDINWKSPVKSGNTTMDFAIVKATQGENYVDAKFSANWNGAQKAGLKVGAYHFYIYKDDPVKQAENYMRNVNLKNGMFRPIVDLELDCSGCSTPGIPTDELVRNVRVFLEKVEQETGHRPIIYSYTYFFETYLKEAFSDYDIWIAQYTQNKPVELPVLPGEEHSGLPKLVMWQFTDKEKIDGWNGNVDANLLPEKCINDVIIGP